jgi:hypothetical protein
VLHLADVRIEVSLHSYVRGHQAPTHVFSVSLLEFSNTSSNGRIKIDSDLSSVIDTILRDIIF